MRERNTKVFNLHETLIEGFYLYSFRSMALLSISDRWLLAV